jgi:glycosyltransferase involved in cell wall biosynthesis
VTGSAAGPLRVLLVSANYRPSIGGIERYVETLAHGLAERGHTVTVAACRTDGAPRAEQDGAVRIVRIPATDVLDAQFNVPYPLPQPLAALRTLTRLIQEADVVNPQDALYATSLLSLAVARRRQVPSVLTQHVAFVPQRNRALDAAQRAAIVTLGRSARLATRVVSYNPAVADWARSTWNLSAVRVLPTGVSDPPEADRGAIRKRFGLPIDRFVALFVGRDVPKKGLDTFLAARDPMFELLAVTDRAPSEPVEGTRIHPFMEAGQFRELLTCVDAFVLPSEGEGFPLALQEALVTGVPCVITPGPGYEYYLRDGEVMPVRPDPTEIRATLRRIAADEPFRRQLASHAREAGRREFGLDRFVEGYEEIYREAGRVLGER